MRVGPDKSPSRILVYCVRGVCVAALLYVYAYNVANINYTKRTWIYGPKMTANMQQCIYWLPRGCLTRDACEFLSRGLLSRGSYPSGGLRSTRYARVGLTLRLGAICLCIYFGIYYIHVAMINRSDPLHLMGPGCRYSKRIV